jgi:hypothetical protein
MSGVTLDKSADEKIMDLTEKADNQQPVATTAPEAPARAATAPEPPARAVTSREAPPPPRSGAAEPGGALTEAQIERKLNEAGYRPVQFIRRDGDAYVARGERNGTVFEVRTEAATGRLLASREIGIVRRTPGAANGGPVPVMTEQQVRSTLRHDGYEMVGDVARAGDTYRAEAMRDGRTYNVVVDARTGRVVTATPAAGAPPPTPGG